jgi:hypothetical protein
VTAEDEDLDHTKKEPAEIMDCTEELECDKELVVAKEKAVFSINVQNRIESRRNMKDVRTLVQTSYIVR